jgi:hypothetical protein
MRTITTRIIPMILGLMLHPLHVGAAGHNFHAYDVRFDLAEDMDRYDVALQQHHRVRDSNLAQLVLNAAHATSNTSSNNMGFDDG